MPWDWNALQVDSDIYPWKTSPEGGTHHVIFFRDVSLEIIQLQIPDLLVKMTRWTADIWFLPLQGLRGHSEAPTIRMIKYDVAEQNSLMVGQNITWKRSIDLLCYPSAMNQDGSWRRIHFGDSLIAIRDLRRVISNSFIQEVLETSSHDQGSPSLRYL